MRLTRRLRTPGDVLSAVECSVTAPSGSRPALHRSQGSVSPIEPVSNLKTAVPRGLQIRVVRRVAGNQSRLPASWSRHSCTDRGTLNSESRERWSTPPTD